MDHHQHINIMKTSRATTTKEDLEDLAQKLFIKDDPHS
jgi:hypothetical protein